MNDSEETTRNWDVEQVVSELAKRDADDASRPASAAEDSTLRELKAELDTLAVKLREPPPVDEFEDESDCRRAVELVERIGREPTFSTQQALEQAQGAELDLGQIGPYQFVEKLGQGGMGAVYKALHTKLKRVVAIKVLPADRVKQVGAIERFEREMEAVGALQHPNIVAAHDAGEANDMHYLVMEYVEGLDLSALVRRVGPIGPADACEIARQAAIGLQEAHEHKMVHRDIKPSNLILTGVGHGNQPPSVKILDLGLALLDPRRAERCELTATGQMMGTLDYMAPEQGDNSHDVDIRADIYSLGATLYKLLCGEAPFPSAKYKTPLKLLTALATQKVPSIATKRDDLPAELVGIVDRMLARQPGDRFDTPADVAAALAPLAADADLASLLDRATSTESPASVDQSSLATREHITADSHETAPRVEVLSSPQADQQPVEAPATADWDKPRRMDASSVHQQAGRTRRPSYETHDGPSVGGGANRTTKIIATLVGLAALFAAVTTIVIQTDKGDIKVVSYDPDIEVTIRRNGQVVDGFEVKQRPNATSYFSGEYEIELKGGKPDGVSIKNGEFKLMRGKTVLVEIIREPTAAAAVAATPAAVIETPFVPPLEEWLQGRDILTVAQDGSGMFDTIQTALDAIQAGQVVQVLDRGPYRERLEAKSLPADVGLVSEVGTIVEIPEWRDAGIQWATVRKLQGCQFGFDDGFRLHGFDFVVPIIPNNSHCYAVWTDGPRLPSVRTTVIQNCRVRRHAKELFRPMEIGPDGITTPDFNALYSLSAYKPNPSLVISDNDFRGAVALNYRGPLFIERNRIGSWYNAWDAINCPIEPKQRVVIRHNQLRGYCGVVLGHRQPLPDTDASTSENDYVITNNLVEAEDEVLSIRPNYPEHEIELPLPPHVRIQNNIFRSRRAGGITFWDENDLPTALKSWRVSHNAYCDEPRTHSGQWPNYPKQASDLVHDIPFLSDDPQGEDFLRVATDSSLATAGVGGDLPKYIGHLPPGPALAGGDWLSRLQSRFAPIPQTRLGWQPGPAEDVLPGLVPRPAKLPGVRRWQVETTVPRGYVWSVDWSSDGRFVAAGSADAAVRIFDADTLELLHLLAGHNGSVQSVAWSPDGKTLASASDDRTVRLWNADGTPGPVLKGHTQGVESVSWSPDGQQLASCSGTTIIIWSPDGEEIGNLHAGQGGVMCLAWTPDGKHVVAGFGNGSIRIFRTDGTLEQTLEGHTNGVSSVAWSPDGKTLASGSRDKTIRLWKVDGTLRDVLEGHEGSVQCLAWSRDSGFLASGGEHRTIRLWKADGTPDSSWVGESYVRSLAWSPDGRRVVAGLMDTTVRIWNIDGTPGPTVSIGRNATLTSVAWSPDSRRLAAGHDGLDGEVQLWGVDGIPELTLRGAGGYCLAWSPDGMTVATGGGGRLLLLNADGTKRVVLDTEGTNTASSVAWRADGKHFAWESGANAVRLASSDGKPGPVLEGANSISWSPDGQRLVTGSPDATARIWQADGTPGPKLEVEFGESVVAVAWSPDGDMIATGAHSAFYGPIRLWNADGTAGPVLKGHTDRIGSNSLAWNPDGSQLASGSWDRTVRLWDRDGTAGPVLVGDAGEIHSLSWSRDGKWLASGSEENTILVRNAETGEPQWSAVFLPENNKAVFSAAGQLLHGDPEVIEKELAYVVEYDDGRRETLKPSEFHDRIVAEAIVSADTPER